MSLKPKVENFEDRWNTIHNVIDATIHGKYVDKSIWTDCFVMVYALCVSCPTSLALPLYQNVKCFLENHAASILEATKSTPREVFLEYYCEQWKLYSSAVSYINQIFGYLNSQFLKKNINDYKEEFVDEKPPEDIVEIQELALNVWKSVVLNNVSNELVTLILEEIQKDRLGESVKNQQVIQGAVLSFVEVYAFSKSESTLLYEKSMEELLLQQVNDFYKQKSMELTDELSVSEYITRCLYLIDDEGLRVKKYLNSSSYDKIISSVMHRLVLDQLGFIQSHFRSMIENHTCEDLSNTYRLLQHAPLALRTLVVEFQNHIEFICTGIIKNLKGENAVTFFAESMMEVHSKHAKVIKDVLSSDSSFIAALDKAFNTVINKPVKDLANNLDQLTSYDVSYKPKESKVSPFPELLVRYCDQLLKKGTKGLNENELEDKLTGAITIFQYLGDKDVFNKVYSRFLARRIIFFQTQSMDAEESMIKKLKQVCGHEYTSKLHRMFTDVRISRDLTDKFFNSLPNPSELGLGFNMLIMQAGAWPLPIPQTSSFLIPQQLEKSLQMFERFYRENFTGRKLMWYHVFSTCEVKMTYLSRHYIIVTSVHTMSILVAFNTQDVITCSDIIAHTGLTEEDMLRSLQQLVDNKILCCDGSEIGTDSKFSLNFEFQSKRQKFKLMQQVKDGPQEVERTVNTINEDRRMFLQAVIVRTMKARKRLKHRDLVDEILKQSIQHFVPSNSLIKKTIEQLIDKQYIERVTDSIDEYSYIA